ncbi:hypothetical protein OBBRIDRAFT_755891 [Obba rivulosa]|uniref:Uncharacterized protein n=1 Tax=Obba rivulosa TaxID=1052685 RepID=A0A8E2ARY1_9APHY|nr:hypothetical protein OBBRIDRAFT_755891 [Obba rivulosa]
MGINDDILPEEYPYAWSPNSSISLQEFLNKFKPSLVQDDGTKPWLWVTKSEERSNEGDTSAAVKEASELLKEVTVKIQNIHDDPSIPLRSNKKKGTKSKKELREELQNEASEKLKEISIRHHFVSGKWLIFAPSDRVDVIWSTIADSLVSGPLSSTSAYLTKVATSPKAETPNYQHVLCVYIPDVYDKDTVTEIMKVLLRKHGVNLSGVKSNLYPAIGLDSKHPSGIQSTVWKNTALMKDADIKGLKDEYFAELDAAKAVKAGKTAETKTGSSGTAKPKPKLKKKAQADNPFGSDDEDEGKTNGPVETAQQEAGKATMKPKSGAKKTVTGKKRPNSDEDDSEVEVKPKKKRGGK